MSVSDGTFLVETADQLRALADPTRQRLLQCFRRPDTAKAVAEKIGQPVTRLYHHIDQLLAAGLIQVVSEERRRAVVERTFQTTASRIMLSPTVFGAGDESHAARLAYGRASVEEVIAAGHDREGAVRLLRTRASLSPAAVEKLEAEITRLLHELAETDAGQVEVAFLTGRVRPEPADD